MISLVAHSIQNKAISVLLVLSTILLSSCDKSPDLSQLKEGGYYVANDKDHCVVLLVDEVTENSFKGRWYVEDSIPAQPHSFETVAKWPHRDELRSDSLIVKANAVSSDGSLKLSLLLDGLWQTLDFQPWQQPHVLNLDKKYPYFDSLYDVSCDTVPYAWAKAYWAEYPEPEGGSNDYLPIVLEKMNIEDLTKKDLELSMDIYRPIITNDTVHRPLLLLIHGGAFFNGDKGSIGYKEWGRYFASRGYIVASINYRIGFLPIWSTQVDRAGYRAVQDAYAAMCYLLRHPNNYPINPDYLFVGGSSAGGITALNLAFMRDKDRPDCTKAGVVNVVSHEYNKLADRIFRYRKHKDRGKEDLGNINSVAKTSGGDVDFKINTVVNMWGAVHTLNMIDNRNNTAILSFHGDADSVVSYDYDYPFTNVGTPLRDLVKKVRELLQNNSYEIDDRITDFLKAVENCLIPVNQFLCNKMYGSKCIHEHALSKGMKSELHTNMGGEHSLHVNSDGTLSDYYDYINDVTTRFLYLRMFPRPTLHTSNVGKQQWFELDNAIDWLTCGWSAEGGLVLEVEPGRARVLFFKDADERSLSVSGQKRDGNGYSETYQIK